MSERYRLRVEGNKKRDDLILQYNSFSEALAKIFGSFICIASKQLTLQAVSGELRRMSLYARYAAHCPIVSKRGLCHQAQK
jgi:hypothetical protein